MASGEDKAKNLKKASEMIISAIEKGAELILLPELFNYLPPMMTKEGYLKNAETFDGPTITALTKIAKYRGVAIIAGSIAEKSKEGVFNTSFLVSPSGILGSYRKVHLFKFGEIDERKVLSAGKEPKVIEYKGLKVGLTICFDLRFPELYRAETLLGAELISIVAAFLEKTGRAHWMPLLRARAIENQLYVLAANQAKSARRGPIYYGNSCIIDPWGKIVARADQEEDVLIADLQLENVEKVRRRLPALSF
jgi:predicted amidohydrolase